MTGFQARAKFRKAGDVVLIVGARDEQDAVAGFVMSWLVKRLYKSIHAKRLSCAGL